MDDDDHHTSDKDAQTIKVAELFLCLEAFRCQAGIPYSVVHSERFISMIQAIGRLGPGYQPPTEEELRAPLLQEQVTAINESIETAINESIEALEKYWALEGCSIMLDAWTDDNGRRLMNLAVHCSHGLSFLRSIHLSSESHDDKYIFELLDSCIEEIGEKNVVHVVTNIEPNNMVAKLLAAKRPNMFWTQCAAHCIGLMLEDIGNIALIKNTVAEARSLTAFIYSCGDLMGMLSKFTNQQDLVQVGITRSTTSYLNLKSLYDKRIELKTMFISKEWEDGKWSKEAVGKKFYNLVVSNKFWHRVLYAINAFEPLVDVLKRMGSGILSMGYIYGDLANAKKEMSLRFEHKEKHYLPVWKIIDKRCDAMLKTPLHLAGYYLNPFFYYQNKAEIENLEIFTDALLVCARNMYKDQSTQERIVNQLKLYNTASKSFGKALAVHQSTEMNLDPASWWGSHGGGAKELTTMAVRILRLTCGSLVCERSWIEKAHKKPPSRFTRKQFKDYTYVMVNLRLEEIAGRKDTDPLVPFQPDDDEPYEWLDMDYNDERPGDSIKKRKSPRALCSEKGKKPLDEEMEEEVESLSEEEVYEEEVYEGESS